MRSGRSRDGQRLNLHPEVIQFKMEMACRVWGWCRQCKRGMGWRALEGSEGSEGRERKGEVLRVHGGRSRRWKVFYICCEIMRSMVEFSGLRRILKMVRKLNQVVRDDKFRNSLELSRKSLQARGRSKS